MGWVKKLLTKNDNITFDEIKVGGFLIILATSGAMLTTSFLCFWLVIIHNGPFDAYAYLQGVASVVLATGSVLVAMGGGIGLRDKLSGGSNAP